VLDVSSSDNSEHIQCNYKIYLEAWGERSDTVAALVCSAVYVWRLLSDAKSVFVPVGNWTGPDTWRFALEILLLFSSCLGILPCREFELSFFLLFISCSLPPLILPKFSLLPSFTALLLFIFVRLSVYIYFYSSCFIFLSVGSTCSVFSKYN
jgi:hypothetical protein